MQASQRGRAGVFGSDGDPPENVILVAAQNLAGMAHVIEHPASKDIAGLKQWIINHRFHLTPSNDISQFTESEDDL